VARLCVGSTFAGQLGDTLVFGTAARRHAIGIKHLPRLRRLYRAGLALQERAVSGHGCPSPYRLIASQSGGSRPYRPL